MKYAKPPLTLEQQADLLISRGMVGDRPLMIERLGVVNYYRLSGYWHPFRLTDPTDPAKLLDTFKPGTRFIDVWNRYTFDRRLRLITIDGIERVEIAVRSKLAFFHAHAHSPFAYASDDPTVLPHLKHKDFHAFINPVLQETSRSKETFIKHFLDKYSDSHRFLPVWIATEIMTFGTMLTFFRSSSSAIRRSVSLPFGVHDSVFDSWLLTFNMIRNICAHHGRLWNRELGVKPQIPVKSKHPEWHVPIPVTNDRVFGVLTLLKYCLDKIAPQSHWPVRLKTLLDEFPTIPRRSMGFPNNWTQCPVWRITNVGLVQRGQGEGI